CEIHALPRLLRHELPRKGRRRLDPVHDPYAARGPRRAAARRTGPSLTRCAPRFHYSLYVCEFIPERARCPLQSEAARLPVSEQPADPAGLLHRDPADPDLAGRRLDLVGPVLPLAALRSGRPAPARVARRAVP